MEVYHQAGGGPETSESEQSQRKLTFLKHVIPFDSLGHEELERLASSMAWREFQPGSIIIKQGVRGTHFYIVQTGLAKVYLREEGKETVLGFLGEADCFGEMALVNRELTAANVEAIEDTLCLEQTDEAFLRMVQAYPVFFRFFSQLLTRRMKSVYKECLCENTGVRRIEPFLFRKQVTEMLSAEAPFCEEKTTIQEVAARLLESSTGSLIVVDDTGHPRGIVGMREMIESVLLGERHPGETAGSIMKQEFGSIDARSYFFDALYEMVKQKADRLVVLDEGKARGLITGFDLLKFRGLEMLSLLKNIDAASTTSELNACRAEVETVLKGLMRDGALASQACRIVSELNDRIVRRIIELAEGSCGAAPCHYAWMGLGSEGRKEQTLLTDQDNALVYRGPSSKATDDYFARFSNTVVNGLAEAGFPLCKGMVMASNEKYRGDLEAWKRRTADWITASRLDEKEIMDVFVFLDFRCNAGDWRLDKELRNHVFSLVRQDAAFVRTLGEYIVDVPVPLGFFKHLIVEKNGQHKNQLNIKTFGLVPLVTCVKLLAWRDGIPETNTLKRISALAAKGLLSADSAEFFEQAFETFLTLKIKNNLSDLEQGREPTNYLDPGLLSMRQKQLLKEAFLAVSELQKLTRETLRITDQPLRG
jgi:CBS domain-containing protein